MLSPRVEDKKNKIMNDPSTDQAEKNRLLAAMNDQLNLNISFGENDPKLQEKL